MTKAELVQQIAEHTGVDRESVLKVVESFMVEVKDSLQRGEEVTLRGFGGFFLKHRAAKTARNIKQNTTLFVPEHDIPAFKPAKEFFMTIKRKG